MVAGQRFSLRNRRVIASCGDVERFLRAFDITVQADPSSGSPPHRPIDMFPGALVTGVRRVKLREALRKLIIQFVRIDNGADLCFWLAGDARKFSQTRPCLSER